MRAARTALLWASLAGLLTSAGACQSDTTPSLPLASVTVASPTPTATPTIRTAVPSKPVPTSKPVPSKPVPSKPVPSKPPPSPVPSKPPGCDVPSGVTSRQVVLVDAHGSDATIRACERSGSRYELALGPYAGHVGRNGVSWSKREGDLQTPAGVFPLLNGFGVYGDPGLGAGSWLRVDSRDVWVDDPGSALYNTHQRLPVDSRWDSAEQLLQSPAYSYAQVIGYNEARTPGAGSAIFMHVDQGRATAGCVSLPISALLSVMRWERSGVVMAISR